LHISARKSIWEEELKQFSDGIPKKVLKEIFPKKFKGREAPEDLYTHLEKMIFIASGVSYLLMAS
jgi:hypothetical protein